MTAGMNTKPPIGRLRFVRKPRDAEEIPVGSIIKTPLGHLAMVIEHRGGGKRGHRVWLVCKYLQPANRAFAVVQILPELAEVVRLGNG
jgi:hypothetical protein